MAVIPWAQFSRVWGLLLLGASSEEIVPGAIVNRRKGFQRIGYLKNLLEGTDDVWPTRMIEGHITDSIEWERSLKGRASLGIPGVIDIGGGLSKAVKGSFRISEVKTRVLVGQDLDDIRLQLRVREWRLEPANRPLWLRMRGHLFVESSWFASEYSLDFQAAGGADIQAEVAGDIAVGAGAEAEWVNKTRLRVTGNDRVPVAIRYWIVRG